MYGKPFYYLHVLVNFMLISYIVYKISDNKIYKISNKRNKISDMFIRYLICYMRYLNCQFK